jgi:signal peptidase I
MEPGFYRGDILLLNNPQQLYVGDVVVFKLEDRTIPIVHRAIDLHITLVFFIVFFLSRGTQLTLALIFLICSKEEEIFLLTKGDNNRVDDRSLYGRNKFWLNRHHILGTAVG